MEGAGAAGPITAGSKFSSTVTVGEFEFLIHYPSVEEELRISAATDSLKPATGTTKETGILLYAWAMLNEVVDRVVKVETKETGKKAPEDKVVSKRVLMIKDNPDMSSVLPRSFKELFGKLRTPKFYKEVLFPLYGKANEFMNQMDLTDDELKNL